MTEVIPDLTLDLDLSLSIPSRLANFPRLRYMGSKYRLATRLGSIFSQIGGSTALDAFSGSGVVSYALKSLGYEVTSNDFMNFSKIVCEAAVVNHELTLSDEDIDSIAGAPADERDFIRRTFDGLFFTEADRIFLDSAWSNVALMAGGKRSLAIASLILAAARRQPRGVFTVTDQRYNDGRRDLKLSIEEHFRIAAHAYNSAVFHSSKPCRALACDVFDLEEVNYDIVYLDPPYAPARNDVDYVKRYHFLEGLSTYWEGQSIRYETKSRQLAKRYTPFSYKGTIEEALLRTFRKFGDSTLVLSYSSNAVPDLATIKTLLEKVKTSVEVEEISYNYSFGTHPAAQRRLASEYIFIAT